jgi:hypothetical protein
VTARARHRPKFRQTESTPIQSREASGFLRGVGGREYKSQSPYSRCRERWKFLACKISIFLDNPAEGGLPWTSFGWSGPGLVFLLWR